MLQREHSGTDNKKKPDVLKVKACKSGFEFPVLFCFLFGYFFVGLMQIKEGMVYLCQAALGAETFTLKISTYW